MGIATLRISTRSRAKAIAAKFQLMYVREAAVESGLTACQSELAMDDRQKLLEGTVAKVQACATPA